MDNCVYINNEADYQQESEKWDNILQKVKNAYFGKVSVLQAMPEFSDIQILVIKNLDDILNGTILPDYVAYASEKLKIPNIRMSYIYGEYVNLGIDDLVTRIKEEFNFLRHRNIGYTIYFGFCGQTFAYMTEKVQWYKAHKNIMDKFWHEHDGYDLDDLDGEDDIEVDIEAKQNYLNEWMEFNRKAEERKTALEGMTQTVSKDKRIALLKNKEQRLAFASKEFSDLIERHEITNTDIEKSMKIAASIFEIEVLPKMAHEYIAQGKTEKQISDELGISLNRITTAIALEK